MSALVYSIQLSVAVVHTRMLGSIHSATMPPHNRCHQ